MGSSRRDRGSKGTSPDADETADAADFQLQDLFDENRILYNPIHHGPAQAAVSARETLLQEVESSSPASRPSPPALSTAAQKQPPKRLRLISDLIERVLVHRAQLRHSQADLQNYRKLLLHSMEALEWRFSAFTQKSTAAASSSVESNASSKRTLMNIPPNLRSLSPATAGLNSVRADAGFVSQTDDQSIATGDDSFKPLASLISQYRHDMLQVKEHELAVAAAYDEMSKLEFELEGALRSLNEDLSSPAAASKALDLLAERIDRSSLSHAGPIDEDDLPPVVEEYFSKIGDIGVFRERLQELNFIFSEGKVARELLADRGDELDVSEASFVRNHETHRMQIEADIEAAQVAAGVLAKRCELRGYNVEQYRRIRKSDSASSMSPLPSHSQLPLRSVGQWTPSETSLRFGLGGQPAPSFARPPSFAANRSHAPGLALPRDNEFAPVAREDPQKFSQRIGGWLENVENQSDNEGSGEGADEGLDIVLAGDRRDPP